MDLTGTLLGGRYRVGPVLGRGGMGLVYEATQEGLDRKVALKVMHSHLDGDAAIRERFRREARAAAMIRHPNVVQINDCVESENEPLFLVMERLYGETLRDVMKTTPQLSGRRVAAIAVQVLSALDAAHRAQVVHRDIKPDNVFLEHTTAQRDIVKLLDFGLAKFLSDDGAKKLTRLGHAVGTPAFMSPEQALNDKVDGRSDLYALGATMYVALTGHKLYENAGDHDLIGAIVRDVPTPIETLRSDIDPGLASVIKRAIEKNPAARYETALEMARALAPFARGAIPQATLQTALEPPSVNDTVRDPVLPAPEAPPTMAVPYAPPKAPARRNNAARLYAAAAAFAMIGIVLAILGALRIKAALDEGPARVERAASAKSDPPQVVAVPLTQEVAPLAPPSASIASTASAAPTPPMPTTPPTATTASALVAPAEPRECAAARVVKAQGRDRQAAQLAIICMRKGGSPPF